MPVIRDLDRSGVRPPGAWPAAVLAAVLLLAPSPSASQPSPDIHTGGMTSETAEGIPIQHDYFVRDRNPAVLKVIRTTERYHLSEDNFWLKRREGNLNAARQDLEFILRYVPNHPKVLQLLAYDPIVKQDVSAVVTHFERAIRAFPRNAYTHAQYGRYLVHIGRREAGLSVLNDALRIDPESLVARAWHADAMAADSSRSAP